VAYDDAAAALGKVSVERELALGIMLEIKDCDMEKSQLQR